MNRRLFLIAGAACFCWSPALASAEARIHFDRHDGWLQIEIDGRPFARYVWRDDMILRPYFTAVHAPNGREATRPHPPVEGQEDSDHATMHPGLWLAFGDLGGADFWRNQGEVRHVEFVHEPHVDNEGGGFTVRNRYVAGAKTICDEVCRIAIEARPHGYLIDWTSEFSGDDEFAFGDQEEMGLGIRVAAPLAVKNGGQIENAEGLKNERRVWGRPSDWCDYQGKIDGDATGIAIMADPKNFRQSWFHARDYGVLVANPFGRNAFTKGEKSKVVVRKGETFRLRFGVLVHSGAADRAAAYAQWQDSSRGKASRP